MTLPRMELQDGCEYGNRLLQNCKIIYQPDVKHVQIIFESEMP